MAIQADELHKTQSFSAANPVEILRIRPRGGRVPDG